MSPDEGRQEEILLRKSIREINRLRAELEAAKAPSAEPIAIVGMSCRTPGGVEDVAGYWAVLEQGRDVIGAFPERFDVAALYDPDPEARGKSYAREGGFLRDVDQFDAGFFGISPREAVSMDPQQRVVLEVAWEALEQAGLRPDALNESSTGVYLGAMRGDYGPSGSALESLDGQQVTGQASSVLSGRVSYVLGLQGPALTVDTACSSSLVALHLACTGLRQGECDLALAGGVQVMSTPGTFVEFSRLRGMAPDGRCKSFSAQADGAGWSEGCGILVLKRLSDAERDGDNVLALVRGSAVNQDGRSQGLTAPNGPSQQRVIRRALAASGLEPGDIDAVEAHGTGTPLGDPIEAGALADVFAPRRDGEPLHLGSSKSNIGHTQAAAGVLGVVKLVLALQHERLPRTLHAQTPSQHIAWEGSGLSLLQETRPWPRRADRPRRAGVSSFGMSGTNVHAIVEEAPEWAVHARPEETPLNLPVPLLVSGRDEDALRAQARRWSEWLAAHGNAASHCDAAWHFDAAWADVVRTAALHRTHFERRAAVFADDIAHAVPALTALAEGRAHPAVSAGKVGGGLAMLFTGQGSQRLGMGRGVHGRAGFEIFTQAFDAAVAACDAHLDRSLREVMWPGDEASGSLLDQTCYTQPALFALEVALFRQWEGWGVRPQIVLGHSIGELVCAHVADVLSLEDAAMLVCARGRLMQELATPGGRMASLEGSEEEVRAAVGGLGAGLRAQLDIAGLNTPRQTVISGGADAVDAMVRQFDAKGRRAVRLTVSHAFHSSHMDPMLEAFRKVAEQVVYRAPRLTVISNVTGKAADIARGELVSADYWVRHVRQPVRFAAGVHGAVQAGARVLLECGPQEVLGALSAAALAESSPEDSERVAIVASLRKDEEAGALLAALGKLHVHGQAVDWKSVLAGSGAGRADLPTYAFQRQRYWWKPTGSTGIASQRLLGQRVEMAGARHDLLVWEADTDPARRRYLGEHAVLGRTIWPVSAQIELALEAARAGLGVACCEIEALELVRTLYAEDAARQRVQVQLERRPGGDAWLRIYARATPGGEDWQLHTRARVRATRPALGTRCAATAPETMPLVAAPSVVAEAVRARAPLEFSMMFFAAMEEDDPTDRYALIIEAARRGDAAGFGAVWVPERHFTHMGSLYPNPSVLHAALARETRRIHLRAGSVVLPLHHPIRVAEEWAMVDNLSGGRIGISLAPGWNPTDFALAPGRYDDRYRDLYAGVERLRELWRGELVTLDNLPGGPTQIRIYPTPVQRELPLWITAARQPESFRQAGALGTNVLTHLLDQDLTALADKIAIYRAARAEHGHDPEAGRVTVMCHTFLADDLATVRKLARKPFCDYIMSSRQLASGLAHSRGQEIDVDALSDASLRDLVEFLYERFEGTRALLGTPQSCLEMTLRLRAAGVDEIACLLDFGPESAAVLAHLPQLEMLRDLHASACAQEKSVPGNGASHEPAALAPRDSVPMFAPTPVDLAAAREACPTSVAPAEFYRALAARGIALSGGLRSLRELAIGDGQALSRIAAQGRGDGPHEVGAAFVDGCMQTALAALLHRGGVGEPGGIFVPVRVGSVQLHRPVSEWPDGDIHAFAQIGRGSAGSVTGSVTAIDATGAALLSIDGVVVERVDARDDELAGWGYEVRWRAAPAGEGAGTGSADGWVLLADAGGVGEAWLARQAGQPLCVRRADAQGALPGVTGFAWLEALDLTHCPGILCLWPLDTPPIAGTDALLAAQQRGVATVVALAQAVASRAGPRPRIWIATRGAQAVTAGDALGGLAHASVWGLAAAVAREHPRIWGGIIDIDAEMAPDTAAAELDGLLRAARGEDQVAVRAGNRYVRRLVRAPLEPAREQFRAGADGTYLIAGGLGGLGLTLARWLVERGARHLLLLGRSTLDVNDARLADLRARGATVDYRAVDVGNADDLERILRDWQVSDRPDISGVVHAAGVFHDQLMEAITPDDLAAGLRAKIVGAYTLDRVLGDLPMDFFLLFSSFSGLTPPSGQAVYAAACAFLDGLAGQRRAAGRTALSIDWGAWSEVGFAATDYGQRAHARLEEAGIRRMTPSQGMQVLERLLGGDPAAQAAVLPVDVAALVSNDPLLAQIPMLRELLGESRESVSATAFLAALNERNIAGQRTLLRDAMRDTVAGVLKQRVERVDVEGSLLDLGLDSLGALQLKNRVARDLGMEMSLVDALRGASIATLAERLLTELRIGAVRAAQPLGVATRESESAREEFVL